MGVEISAKYGGIGSSFFNSGIIVEEIAKVDPAVAVLVDVQNTLVGPIADFGSEEQKQKYLSRMHKDWVSQVCNGAINETPVQIAAFCLSEPESGSDAFALKTTAKADGDDYIISGAKLWISSSEHANFFLVSHTLIHRERVSN